MSVQLSRLVPATAKQMGSLAVSSLDFGEIAASPIIAVDDFRVTGRPFGPHPHAGFSAVTYVFPDSPGSLRNRDSLDGHVVVDPGGICWFQAGRGAQHEEIPARAGATLHGLQVFVNLRRRNKQVSPRTLSLVPAQVPVWTGAGGDVVRVVVGTYEGLSSPLAPVEPFTLLDVAVQRTISVPVAADHHMAFYVRRGTVELRAGAQAQRVSAGQAVVATGAGGPGAVQVLATSPADLIVLGGAALDEPVLAQGPFVMTEPAELAAAAARYRAGQMGHLEPYAAG